VKICQQCNAHYGVDLKKCPKCKGENREIEGFISYAPEFAYEGGGFHSEYFSKLAELEKNNFWFRARNKLIVWGLEKYCGEFSKYLEIGCGTGYVLSGVRERFPRVNLMGSEIFVSGLSFAARRVKDVQLIQMDARSVPFFEEFDVIGAFDVIEHIREDLLVLDEVYKSLKRNGYFVLTVPQHMWLWSSADEYAQHERRYSAQELHEKLESSGFSIQRSTSFVSFLLPFMALSRKSRKNKKEAFNFEKELKINWAIDKILYGIMMLEKLLITFGVNFSVGGSRFVVAQKS